MAVTEQQRPTLILDFDGTIATGNGPILAYAAAAAARIGDEQLLADAHDAIARFETGTSTFHDGYSAVAAAATARGATPDDLNRAYHSSRDLLGSDEAPVGLPGDFAQFLERVSEHVELWLVTNAPSSGIVELLATIDAERHFDAMHFRVGKPDGLVPLLADAARGGPVLSIGDVYDFDLAPAAAVGAATGLVGVSAASNHPNVTMHAPRLDDLYPAIETWAAAAASGS